MVDVQRLRALLAAATPGPWRVFTPEEYVGPDDLPTLGVEAATGEAVIWYADKPESGLEKDADAALIAAMRNEIEGLLAIAEAYASAEVATVQSQTIWPQGLANGQTVRLVRVVGEE